MDGEHLGEARAVHCSGRKPDVALGLKGGGRFRGQREVRDDIH